MTVILLSSRALVSPTFYMGFLLALSMESIRIAAHENRLRGFFFDGKGQGTLNPNHAAGGNPRQHDEDEKSTRVRSRYVL